jgi:predicted ester cyclase
MTPSPLGKSPHAISRLWNTGDISIASQILHPDWIDHAHPEVTGPHGVRQAVERIRAAQPDLRFQIDTILGDGDLIAVIGSVSQSAQHPTTRMVCLIGMKDGRMAVMRTYRDTSE